MTLARPRDSTSTLTGADAPSGSGWRLIGAAFVWIGFAATNPQWRSIDLGGKSFALIVACFLSLIGWKTAGAELIGSRYQRWAMLLGACLLISGVAAWSFGTITGSLKLVLWVAFLVPGVSVLFRDQRMRFALLTGWAAGAAVFCTTATYRWVRGQRIFDNAVTTHLLGVNRNAVNIAVLTIFPFVMLGVGGRVVRYLRVPLLAVYVFWLLNSGGRTAILGLVLIAAVYVLIQPSLDRRVVLATAGVVALLVAAIVVQAAGGTAIESTNRLFALLHGERTNSDEARIVLLHKSVYLAEQNPFFGVGVGRFITTATPVSDQTPTKEVRAIVNTHDEHNTYLEGLAEWGLLGFVFFIGLLILVTRSAWRLRRSREGSVLFAAFIAVLMSLAFTTGLPSLYYPIALVLGLSYDQLHRPAAAEPTPALLR